MVWFNSSNQDRKTIKQKLENIYTGSYTGFTPQREHSSKEFPANHLQFVRYNMIDFMIDIFESDTIACSGNIESNWHIRNFSNKLRFTTAVGSTNTIINDETHVKLT